MPSIGASSTNTHASTRAVENAGLGGKTPNGRGPVFQSFSSFSPVDGQDGTPEEELSWNEGRVQSPDSVLSDRAVEDEADGHKEHSQPHLEHVNSDRTVDTVNSTGAVEDDEDGVDHVPKTLPTPEAHDYARPDEEMSVIEGYDVDPIAPRDGEVDGDQDLSSTESEGSMESAGSAGSQLRRRGGIRETYGRKGRRARAASAATTVATTMETDPMGGATARTAQWLKGHALVRPRRAATEGNAFQEEDWKACTVLIDSVERSRMKYPVCTIYTFL
jgi:hypothetical protein